MSIAARIVAAIAAVSVALGLFVGVPPAASAASGKDFNPGHIIADSVFYDARSMTESSIQSFLNDKVPSCAAGYTCLKDYRQSTTSRAADPMCDAYHGAQNEPAARILQKVAQACGISPKVLLVLLQKEQSLVIDSSPSSRQYRSATGYGCPDTAPCDAEYYGFFNQVYKAAWALQRYAMPPGTGPGTAWNSVYNRYRPGRTVDVLYHPNSACGAKPVYIQNQPTASLYYYTPYQPNTAAVSAGYGVGDACSSYGNRNFFLFFTDWFGSTGGFNVAAPLKDYWTATGGFDGVLGAPTAAMKCGLPDSGCTQTFRGGVVHYSAATGAHRTAGAVYERWTSTGWERGPLGYPTADQAAVAGVAGLTAQQFQRGIVYTSAAGTVSVEGALYDRFQLHGGLGGELGAPVANAVQVAGAAGSGWVQAFSKGVLYARAGATVVTMLSSAITDEYARQGGPAGGLGWPEAQKCGLVGDGCFQHFQRGSIHSSASGAFRTDGKVRSAWGRAGWEGGALGYPAGNAAWITGNGGGLAQPFAGGAVYQSKAVGAAYAVPVGAIADEYARQGGTKGSLGWPTSDQKCGLAAGGCYQHFQKGSLHFGPAGAFRTDGAIRTLWGKLGWEKGALGYPTSAAKPSGAGTVQSFQHGSIYYSKSTGAVRR